MAYVIAEPCIGTKDTACVDACPVDCIHPKKDEATSPTRTMLYIDPVECIDCGACVPVCPVSAIFALDDLPEKWKDTPRRTPNFSAGNPPAIHQKHALRRAFVFPQCFGSGGGCIRSRRTSSDDSEHA